MDVNLMHNMEQENNPKMPNWPKIKALIPRNNLRPDMLEFSQTHGSTNGKIAMTDYHYHILDQLYRPSQTYSEADTKWWARAEMHCIITNLYSALDSLTHEINLAYNLGLQPDEVISMTIIQIQEVIACVVGCLKAIQWDYILINN
jgi:hypothetical protein